MLELNLEKKQASPTHNPTPQTGNEKGREKKKSPIKSSSFLSWTNLVNWTSKWKHSSPLEVKNPAGCSGVLHGQFYCYTQFKKYAQLGLEKE